MTASKSANQATYNRKAAKTILAEAKRLAKSKTSFMQASNLLFGLDSEFSKHFATREQRAAYHAGPEHRDVRKLLAGLPLPHESGPEPNGPSGKFMVRLPQSLHAALQQEAEAEGVSVNQLVVSKLSIGLREMVLR